MQDAPSTPTPSGEATEASLRARMAPEFIRLIPADDPYHKIPAINHHFTNWMLLIMGRRIIGWDSNNVLRGVEPGSFAHQIRTLSAAREASGPDYHFWTTETKDWKAQHGDPTHRHVMEHFKMMCVEGKTILGPEYDNPDDLKEVTGWKLFIGCRHIFIWLHYFANEGAYEEEPQEVAKRYGEVSRHVVLNGLEHCT